MMKARIYFDVDLSDFTTVHDKASINSFIVEKIISPARISAIAALHAVRKSDSLDVDVKAIQIAEKLLEINLLLRIERDMAVDVTPVFSSS